MLGFVFLPRYQAGRNSWPNSWAGNDHDAWRRPPLFNLVIPGRHEVASPE